MGWKLVRKTVGLGSVLEAENGLKSIQNDVLKQVVFRLRFGIVLESILVAFGGSKIVDFSKNWAPEAFFETVFFRRCVLHRF